MEENKSLFDFDGTLIRINSFPYWIMFSGGYALISFKLGLFFKIINLLFERKIQHKISHVEFKRRLIELPISENSNQKFGNFLLFFVRKELKEELKKLHEQNHKIVISSAAPEVYLKKSIELIFPEIHQNLMILGSKLNSDGELLDNFKEEKLRILYEVQFLKENENFNNLYTDSWDDAALAFQSENVFLISPKKQCDQKFLTHPELSKKLRKLEI